MFLIPDTFAQTIFELYQDEGKAWLEGLPALLGQCQKRWSLTIEAPYELSYNYVAPAVTSRGTKVVLKVGVPNPELLTEIAALGHFNGRGMVQLLDADPELGLLLLEQLEPGNPLFELEDDEEAIRIAAQVMGQFWRTVPSTPNNPFPTVARWAVGLRRLREHFNGGTGPFSSLLIEKAETLFEELLPTMAEPVLLHGDLHHWNILSAKRQPWLALDPKGIIGEPAYEVGALLRNPMPHILEQDDPTKILARRVKLLAQELGFAEERILGWGIAQAVLSAWWSYEDHGYGWETAVGCATILSNILG